MSFITNFGGRGLGALNRALENNRMTIRDASRKASQQGFQFGTLAQDKINRYYGTHIGEFGGNTHTNSSGLAAVQRAMATGMTADGVQDRGRQENITWGGAAQQFFDDFNRKKMESMFPARPSVPIYQAPTYEAPVIPDPKTLTTQGSAVGGGAKGVKIKRSEASKKSKNSRGTKALSRGQRASSMKISNLNLT